ncbi:MAG TPA: VOC family protein [Acidimicrobiales bacterium]|nr:VOC family protein [Acidimicrobiales bacterium]
MNTASGAGAPITGLSHVQLLVSDVSASAAWYALALGLERYIEDLDIGYVALRHREARIVVVLTTAPGIPSLEQDDPLTSNEGINGSSGRLDHLAFAVPDNDSLLSWAGHLSDLGINHAGVVLENGNPSLQLRDPDGIAVELVAPGSRSTSAPTREPVLEPGS